MTYSETGSTEQFDHSSMLDGRTEPAKIGSNTGNTNFFRNYCFKILRFGDCNKKDCNYSHTV